MSAIFLRNVQKSAKPAKEKQQQFEEEKKEEKSRKFREIFKWKNSAKKFKSYENLEVASGKQASRIANFDEFSTVEN